MKKQIEDLQLPDLLSFQNYFSANLFQWYKESKDPKTDLVDSRLIPQIGSILAESLYQLTGIRHIVSVQLPDTGTTIQYAPPITNNTPTTNNIEHTDHCIDSVNE